MKKESVVDKYKGQTMSSIAKAIEKKYPNKDTDLIQKESFNQELKMLFSHQEKKKMISEMEDAIKQFKCGGKLPKHAYGGLLGDPNDPKKTYSILGDQPLLGLQNSLGYQGQINNMYPGQISYPNTWAETPRPQDNIQPIETLPISPMGYNGPPKPFTGQVDTLKSGITNETPSVFGGNPLTIDNSLGMSTPQDAPTTPREGGSAYTPALVGQGLSTIINAGILAGGYDKVAPVDNPYESQVKNLMASRGIDTTQQRNQILSSYNAAKDNLDNVRSPNVRNALDANMLNIVGDNLAESKLNEQNLNNSYKADYSQVLNSLGRDKANAQVYAETATAQNKGQFQSNLSAEGASIANNAQFFTNKKLNDVQNKLLGDILSNKFADVGLNPDVVTRLNEGKLTPNDITKLQGTLGKEKADSLIEAFKLK